MSLSSLQSSLISTVYLWFNNGTSVSNSEVAFLKSINNLSNTYPNETDIQVLRGLSMLNVANQTESQDITENGNLINARKILRDVLTKEPEHPGALHYLVHAYDVAQVDIAEQAIGYALSYGKVANTSSNAQHMLSHIWMRTGL
jgi:hypothetical protein